MAITLYHHKDCVRCARMARVHRFFDWFKRVRISTSEPRTGPLVPGEIAVEVAETGEIVQGVEAVRSVARNIPAYAPLRPLLWVPPIARWIDREVRGCRDGSCEVRQS